MANINYTFELNLTAEISYNLFQLNQTYTLEMDILSEVSVEVQASKLIDLLQLVPEKFRDSPLFQDYLQIVGLYVGTWLAKVDDMKYLVDPYNVSDELKVSIPEKQYVQDEEYISHLASLIGLTIIKNTGDDIDDFRRQLTQAVDWYKLKGSYQALTNIIYVAGQQIEIKDLYTNDYASFTPEDWFVADYPGENPVGLDDTYYKSPHFGLQIELNQIYYTTGGLPYLWKGDDKFANVRGYVEQVRPANTVPHYIISMTAPTSESGIMQTTAYGVSTRRIYEPWLFSQYYFDQDYLVVGQGWNLDDGKFFDFTNTTFLASVNHYKLGQGNLTPDTSGWEPEPFDPVVEGILAVSNIRLYTDRTEYEVLLDPTIVQAGITQVGLYLPDNTTLVIGCTFPVIDKIENVELRILIVMYK